jgi:hypothetical protein
MTDGIKFASNRIAILEAEMARLRKFINVSEKLFKEGWLGITDGPNESGQSDAEVSGTETVGKKTGTARKNDAVEGDGDLPARELKSEEQMNLLRPKKNGADPEGKKTLFRRAEQ